MRMSRLFGTTLRSAPGTVEAAGHQLLLRAGYLRPLNQGVFSYLPLGVRVIRRIEAILRQEMEALVLRRGFDFGERCPSATDLFDDLVGFCVPHEGLGVIVPVLDPQLDGVD